MAKKMKKTKTEVLTSFYEIICGIVGLAIFGGIIFGAIAGLFFLIADDAYSKQMGFTIEREYCKIRLVDGMQESYDCVKKQVKNDDYKTPKWIINIAWFIFLGGISFLEYLGIRGYIDDQRKGKW